MKRVRGGSGEEYKLYKIAFYAQIHIGAAFDFILCIPTTILRLHILSIRIKQHQCLRNNAFIAQEDI